MTAKVVAPKLRFKNSGGEDFPEALPRKFNQITDKISDGIHSTPTYSESGDYYFVNGNNLINGQIVITPSTKKIDRSQYEIHKSDLNDRSILISINGTIGNLAFYKGEEVVLGKSACYINLKIGENKKYVYQLLQTEKIKNYFGQELTGSTIKNLSLTTIKNALAHFPSEEEQTKIADFLTAVDTKISQLSKKYKLLSSYKKGVMQMIFKQELRFKDNEGRKFSEWNRTTLGLFATIVGGGTPDTGNTAYWGGNIQWFTPTELKNKYTSSSSRTITDQGLKQSSAKLLPLGAVLFSSRATVGDASIATEPCTTNQGFQSFIVNKENNNEFLYYWILNNKKLFVEKASGSTFLEISKKEIDKLPIEKPCLLEQIKIASFLTAIDNKITNVKFQLESTKQYKQGLMQQMFT